MITTKARSLYSSIAKEEFSLMQPDYAGLVDDVELLAYPLEEIFLEKIRAILTRRGTKSRDYIDVYLILQKTKLDVKKEEANVLQKIEFMLTYDKYLQHLSVINPERLLLGDMEQLLLRPVDDGFKTFLPEFFEYLKRLEEKLTA